MLFNDFITSSSPISKYEDRADNFNSHFTVAEFSAISKIMTPYCTNGFLSPVRHENSLKPLFGKQSTAIYFYANTKFMTALWLQKTIFPDDLPAYGGCPEVRNVSEYQAQFGMLEKGLKEAAHFKTINFGLFLKQIGHHAGQMWPNDLGLQLVHGA